MLRVLLVLLEGPSKWGSRAIDRETAAFTLRHLEGSAGDFVLLLERYPSDVRVTHTLLKMLLKLQ